MKPVNNSNEVRINRVYDAPVSLVWEAWTDPSRKSHWWGPRGFTITTAKSDVRAGGQWIYTMHGSDGVNYPNITTYLAVEPLRSVEYDHGATENQKPLFRVRVNFTEWQGQTEMKMSMFFETPQVAEQMCQFIKQANGNSTWDRLGEYLEKESRNREIFILNRVFEAPATKIFENFSIVTLIEKWQPPTGFTMRVLSGEIEVGRSVFYEMGNQDFKFYGRSTYQEILIPQRISFVQEFCDENGKNSQHPGAPTWPKKWQTTLSLTEESSSSTRITLSSEVLEPASASEKMAFINERAGMNQGWNGSFDRLEELLSK